MKKIRYVLEYLPVWLAVRAARLLPLGLARRLADGLAFLAGSLLGLRKQVVRRNLDRAFPEKPEKWKDQTGGECYRFFARMVIEWVKTPALLARDKVEFKGAEEIESYLDQDQGVVVLTAHLGYWELVGALIARRFGGITCYADVIHNPYVHGFVERQRSSLGIETVTGKWAMKDLARELRQGRVVGLVGDQSKGGRQAEVPFFGYNVKNTRMPAFLARTTDAPVVPLMAVRSAADKIRVEVDEPLEGSLEGMSGPADEERMLTEYNRWLERKIRQYPAQYFWLHRRWKDAEQLEKDDREQT